MVFEINAHINNFEKRACEESSEQGQEDDKTVWALIKRAKIEYVR